MNVNICKAYMDSQVNNKVGVTLSFKYIFFDETLKVVTDIIAFVM